MKKDKKGITVNENVTSGMSFSDNSEVTVRRGDKSFGYFCVAWGILSTIIVYIIDGEWYKVINLGILIYLVFYNSWFQNKIMTIIDIFKNREI